MEKTWMSLIALWALCWFWVYQDWRYFLPAIALMAALEAFWAIENWRLGRWKLVSVFALVLAVAPVLEISANNESYAFFHLKPQQSHLSSRQRYLELSLGPPFMVEEIANKILPPKAKILMYRDVRGYYLDRDYAWGDPLNPGVVDFLSVRSSADLLSRLRAQGFGYILYDPWIGHYQGYPGYYQRADRLVMGVLARSQKLVSIGGVSIDRLPARGEGGLSLNPPANN